MGENIFAKMMVDIARRGLENQIVREGDFYDDNGFLICGKCKQPRQRMQDFQVGTNAGEAVYKSLKVIEECECDRKEREAKELEKKREEEMAWVRRLKKLSLMDERFEDASFENFKTNKYNQRNLKLCKRYATSFDQMLEKCQGLLMWGNVGTGKSFAAAAIANYLLEHKVPVIMTSFTKILGLIDSDRSEESNTSEKLSRAKLVIFDDLGAERSTDYALEKVYNIVDERYRLKLPMILTTNLTLDEMKAETDIRYARIYDRIFETCYPMQFTGPSWRKVAASKRFTEMEKFLEGED